MTWKRPLLLVASAAGLALFAFEAVAWQDPAATKPKFGFSDTPIVPGTKWHVHDGERPQPRAVTPGTCTSQETPGQPPSDAVVLFDGKDLSKWHGDGGKPAGWKVEDSAMVV